VWSRLTRERGVEFALLDPGGNGFDEHLLETVAQRPKPNTPSIMAVCRREAAARSGRRLRAPAARAAAVVPKWSPKQDPVTVPAPWPQSENGLTRHFSKTEKSDQ